MNAGKIAAGALVLTGVIAGALVYWLQVHAFYERVEFPPGEGIGLVPLGAERPEPVIFDDLSAIDADSSPLRFRACFTLPLDLATLSETYVLYEAPTPLNGPGWFSCYDAAGIGAALDRGQALAFLSEHRPGYGIDRVVAVMADGRAFAWHQMNACGKALYAREALPAGCPPPPEDGTP
ncbi:DUF6446 family protein [Pseudogemmobacter sonorensis]|uniref:DUF6446 family protein n=1 Tax=Pseudogemmobacter sonorensis TaxID=2989681 RepID=UPI0036ABF50B